MPQVDGPNPGIVRGLFWVWVNWIARLLVLDRGLHLSRGIILGTIPSWFLGFHVRVLGCPGTVPESVRICGFKKKSSKLDRARKMRGSVLLISWDNFVLTLPSISSETCVLYSSLILGTDVFRDSPFRGCSFYVSLETAANFRLFLNVATFLRGKCSTMVKIEFFFNFNELESTLKCNSFWRINSLQLFIVNWFTKKGMTFLNISTLVPLIYTFSLAEK